MNLSVADYAISSKLDRLSESQKSARNITSRPVKMTIFTAPITKLVENYWNIFYDQVTCYGLSTNVDKEEERVDTTKTSDRKIPGFVMLIQTRREKGPRKRKGPPTVVDRHAKSAVCATVAQQTTKSTVIIGEPKLSMCYDWWILTLRRY